MKNIFKGVLVVFLFFLTAQRGYSGERPTNFVIVFTDDLGYGDLACYGNKVTRTPNIAHIAGIEVPQDRVIDGMNIFELFMDPKGAESPHAYFAYYLMDQMKAIRVGDWKLHLPLDAYIDMWGKDLGPREARLFNLKDDVSESIDLSEQYPEKLEEMLVMAQMAGNWIGDRNKPTPNTRPAGFVEKPLPLEMK